MGQTGQVGRGRAKRLVFVGLAAVGSVMCVSTAAGAVSNPPSNETWTSTVCDASGSATPTVSPACVAIDLPHIDAARAAEGVKAMILPANYTTLTPGEQLFVVTNLERVDRGLPAVSGLTSELDGPASQGAGHGTDPPFPAGRSWGGAVWAGGYPSTLEAVYAWMYNDGPGSSNEACTAPGQPGCWGHRDNVLANPPGQALVAGAATGYGSWGTEYAMVSAQMRNGAGPLYYTWLDALGQGADGASIPPPAPPAPAPALKAAAAPLPTAAPTSSAPAPVHHANVATTPTTTASRPSVTTAHRKPAATPAPRASVAPVTAAPQVFVAGLVPPVSLPARGASNHEFVLGTEAFAAAAGAALLALRRGSSAG